MKQRIDALGATNVATVWQSASYAKDGDAQYKFDFSNANHLADWYPGDDVVDWVALSTFYWDANSGSTSGPATTRPAARRSSTTGS
ncbi:hypothetical protein [Dactylosporangium cerinum]